MSLNVNKLEKVVELANGAKRARCPACAESGQDRKGEHLRIYPDGKFGCCVFAGDREHRKRIFALVGVRERQAICVKVAPPKVSGIIQGGVLGRLGRVFGGLAKPAPQATTAVGTLGTGQYSYTCERKNPENEESYKKLIEYRPCVPSVPVDEGRLESEIPVPGVPSEEKLPFLTPGGTLSIPFDSPDRYHYWKLDGIRLHVSEILAEVKERMKNAITV